MALLQKKLSADALVIMDDIHDNTFFMELCQRAKQPFQIFEFEGKYIGLLGKL